MPDDNGGSEIAIPLEFLGPEGDAELQDPTLNLEGLELSTAALREEWRAWGCRLGDGKFDDPKFFGRSIGGVPTVAVDAFRAMEQALRASGYVPERSWSYNCRKIGGSQHMSLHSFGIAVDLDPKDNPFTPGDPYAGKLQQEHVEAVLAIKNSEGASVWSWGGHWSKPDRMHFQLDVGPDAADVDWSTVPGATGPGTSGPGTSEPGATAPDEAGSLPAKGSRGPAVRALQDRLRAWNADALPRFGSDGDYGNETTEWVRRFQEAHDLPATGSVDKMTAASLSRYK